MRCLPNAEYETVGCRKTTHTGGAMANDVEAVIEALKIALEEACNAKDETWWKVDAANRWINRLPGAWTGRWRDLKLKGDSVGEVDRAVFIGHLRATLAYLEANRETIPRSWPWSIPRAPTKQDVGPIDAEFDDVSPPMAKLPPSGKRVRLIK